MYSCPRVSPACRSVFPTAVKFENLPICSLLPSPIVVPRISPPLVVIATGEEAPMVTPSIVPPLMSAVVAVKFGIVTPPPSAIVIASSPSVNSMRGVCT